MEKEHTAVIRWPSTGKVEVRGDVDFVYIMRKDAHFAMAPVVTKLGSFYHLDEQRIKFDFMEKYDDFFASLADSLLRAYSSKGKCELHLFSSQELDSQVREKSAGRPLVSLDPLLNEGVYEIAVSRGYFLGGMVDFGQVARPGKADLERQAQAIKIAVGDTRVNVGEDDIFSGGSLVRSLELLLSAGVPIAAVIPGIQVGNTTKIGEMGIEVNPVVKYLSTDGVDIFSKVDLGDPRDFLVGASGLVVKLPGGNLGRAPYILPFVSPAARVSIPMDKQIDFSIDVLEANYKFFSQIEESIRRPVLLRHMDSHFVIMMREVFGFDWNTPMVQVVCWAANNMEKIWEVNSQLSSLQQQ